MIDSACQTLHVPAIMSSRTTADMSPRPAASSTRNTAVSLEYVLTARMVSDRRKMACQVFR